MTKHLTIPSATKACIAILLVFAAGGWLFRAALLCGIARMLIVDQSGRAASYICIHGDELSATKRYFDRAAAVWGAGAAKGVLIVEPKASRLVQSGVVPSFATLSRRALTARGVPQSAIVEMTCETLDPWQEARRLGAWLQAHPDARVQLLCERFESRLMRSAMDAALAPADAARAYVSPMPNPLYDESNWWHSRRGVRGIMFGILSLAYGKLHGPSAHRFAPLTVEEYEQILEIPPRS